ncbi:glycerophosphodiester phosphodiesterase [Natrinema sp. 74]|uniref:glycerophosphodiester phosphodiesterase n=1 Tax=Natrinema sp. 74 TaxID=3384159 RepID=UPI0038D50E4B
MDLIAHRGCSDEYPENTLLAIERAARRLPAVEFDVRRCRSGELVVVHDEHVARVTDGVGAVADLHWDDLRELTVLDSDERIPLFSEALAAVPDDVDVQVELKETGIAVDAVALGHDAEPDIRFTSFLPDALAEARDVASDAALGYLFDHHVGVDTGLATARELECEFLHPHADLCLETDVLERAEAAGMDVIAWGVDDAATCTRLRSAGVDGATADSWTLGAERPELGSNGAAETSEGAGMATGD